MPGNCPVARSSPKLPADRSVVVDNPATLAIARLYTNGGQLRVLHAGSRRLGVDRESLAPVIDGPCPPSGPPVAVHTGTLAVALQPSGAVIENLLGRARDGMTISVDPNLWPTPTRGAAAGLTRRAVHRSRHRYAAQRLEHRGAHLVTTARFRPV